MTDERLENLLRSAVPPSLDDGPRRDLWPVLARRFDDPPQWSYFDLSLAVAVVVVLAIFPEWLWLLAYHL